MSIPTSLWVIPVANMGGVARHVLDATRVGIPGFEIGVLCPEGPLAERLREQDVTVHVGDFGPHAGLWKSRTSLRRAIAQLRPDIIHTHLSYADIVASMVRLPPTTIRVSTEHGIASDEALYHSSPLKAGVMKLAHRWRLSRTRGVIAVSRSTRDVMIQQWKPATDIVVIYNGVDRPPSSRGNIANNSPIRVLSLCRLSPEKRIDKLIEAFGQLKRQHPSATLTIAGEGPLRGQLEAQVAGLGLQASVTFPGYVDPEVALAKASVLAQLSHWENCSYTLLDARVGGAGIVASAVGGNAEILDGDELVNPEIIDEVVDALIRQHASGAKPPQSWLSVEEMCLQIGAAYDAWRAVPATSRGRLAR
ncbi:MAG: glycosyltransferase [Actinomycetales bacterium]|nr:glycosyltransferase [Actinomycetales bacterium]